MNLARNQAQTAAARRAGSRACDPARWVGAEVLGGEPFKVPSCEALIGEDDLPVADQIVALARGMGPPLCHKYGTTG